jgi:hypothetical protein
MSFCWTPAAVAMYGHLPAGEQQWLVSKQQRCTGGGL